MNPDHLVAEEWELAVVASLPAVGEDLYGHATYGSQASNVAMPAATGIPAVGPIVGYGSAPRMVIAEPYPPPLEQRGRKGRMTA